MTSRPPIPPVPAPGTYHVLCTDTDAVARATLRTVAGPVHLLLPVLEAGVRISPSPADSSIEVDLAPARLTTSLPLPLRKTWDERLGEAVGSVRLETFALDQFAKGRMRASADLYAGDGTTEVALRCRLTEAVEGSVRLAIVGRFSRAALGLGRGGHLAADQVRFVLALHAKTAAGSAA